MKRRLIDSIPALTGLAAALLDAALNWAGTLHVSSQNGLLIFGVAVAVGRAVSVWLHAREDAQRRISSHPGVI